MTRIPGPEGTPSSTAPTKRPVGRPKLKIDRADVAAVAGKLYRENGSAVSMEDIAEGLGVSRATLYRTVRTMDELHGLLLDEIVHGVERDARALLDEHSVPREALVALIRFQVHASINMRDLVGVYFGWGLSPETYARWRKWARSYEALWTEAVQHAVDDGQLQTDNIHVTTRLIMGMVNWVSRWYQPNAGLTDDDIANEAVRLVFPNGQW
ncbi:TetR/AcrR family transcriptional regulator [Nocardia alni]|uniref:TetR/AcrR family transcriptional regulator n=1 Tax=Nocardia alni TaxID=2815723 RepID=UPI001C24F85B|nr:TetR/AcrR family transcriptional regulator [Nocardia alni]